MRPVEMNRASMLAASIYAILEDRLAKARVNTFSVEIQLLPSCFAKRDVTFGGTISGYIQLKNPIHRREFAIHDAYGIDDRDICIEVSCKTEHYQQDNPIAYIDDVKGHVEIDFDKRTVTYKRVHNFNMKNISWDWESCKSTALDIIGMILGEENS